MSTTQLPMKVTNEFPRFCPACGERRLLQDPRKVRELRLISTAQYAISNAVSTAISAVVTEGPSALTVAVGQPENGVPIFVNKLGEQWQQVVREVVESVPYCTRCGFVWVSMEDPGTALTRRLLDLPDAELTRVMKLFYPNFHLLVSTIAKKMGMSLGHVQRVLDGERKSEAIDRELVMEFRSRLMASGITTIV